MKARSEMISFWDGRGPSKEKEAKNQIKSFVCMHKAIKMVSLQRPFFHNRAAMNRIYVRAEH